VTVSTGDLRQTDVDSVLILIRDSYYVARYDQEADKVTQYQKVLLSNVERLEFGQLHLQVRNKNIKALLDLQIIRHRFIYI